MSPAGSGEPGTPRVVTRSLITAVLVVVLFAVLPVDGAESTSSLVVIASGLVLLAVLVAIRVRQIVHDSRPRLRAAEGLALVVPLFVAVFAWGYLLLSQAEPTAFSEPLNRVDAAYFTLSILSTVGFGDISAQNDLARLLVSLQIVLTFTLLAGVVRLILEAGRSRSAQAGR
jgi:voltage-gated potassium channel